MTYRAIPTSGDPIVLVGHVHAFPSHPAPGTIVDSLIAGYSVAPNEHPSEWLHALVSVDWATKFTTIDADTGASSTEYRRGFLGVPDGWTWYLVPVQFDPANGGYRTSTKLMARGNRDARLPPEVVALGAPDTVHIHDFVVS